MVRIVAIRARASAVCYCLIFIFSGSRTTTMRVWRTSIGGSQEAHLMPRFLFVTGGVASSVGKGISVASIGRLLKSRGLRVAIMKLDPYINVDPGTMSPYQHGEVFVTD